MHTKLYTYLPNSFRPLSESIDCSRVLHPPIHNTYNKFTYTYIETT